MKYKKENGMSLVETIIAISILVIAITGPLVLAQRSIKSSRDSRNEFAATNLAVEGVEAVENIRMNNTASGNAWMTNLLSCTTGCVLDITQQQVSGVWNGVAVTACPGGDCAQVSKLYYNPNTGVYLQTVSGTPVSPWRLSPFRRIITVNPAPGGLVDSYSVKSIVYYQRSSGGEGKIELSEELYNWAPQFAP